MYHPHPHKYCVLRLLFTYEESVIFAEWKVRFGKKYSSKGTEEKAKQNFIINLKFVVQHNQMHGTSPNITFSAQLWEYSDMSNEDFNVAFNGFKDCDIKSLLKKNSNASSRNLAAGVNESSYLNWMDKGIVSTLIRNQYLCASCYAFASLAALEAHIFMSTGVRVKLSAQNIVDCSINS